MGEVWPSCPTGSCLQDSKGLGSQAVLPSSNLYLWEESILFSFREEANSWKPKEIAKHGPREVSRTLKQQLNLVREFIGENGIL